MAVDFTADDWARIRSDYTRWWRGELDRPLFYFHEVTRDGKERHPGELQEFLTNYPAGVTPEEIVGHFVAYESERVYPGDTYPFWCINSGPGILSAALGARVKTAPDTVWFEPAEAADITSLDITFDTENPYWKRVVAVTVAAVERIGDIVQITHTDMGGNLDILAGLIGTEALLMAMFDCPEKVTAALARITKYWIEVYDELYAIIRRRCPGAQSWGPLWAPGTTYFLQSDVSYMISPEMYRRFVLPDIAACAEHLDYPFYHLDGTGALAHVDAILSIKKLRGIQWNPGEGKPDPKEWLDLFRRIRAAGKLVQVCTSRAGAEKICSALGGRGFHVRIWEALSAKEAEEFLRDMRGIGG